MTVNLAVAKFVLKAEFRRPVGPRIVIREAVVFGRDERVGTAGRAGALNHRTHRTRTHIGDACFFLFTAPADAGDHRQGIGQVILTRDKGAQNLVILLTAAIEGQRAERGKIADFGVGNRLVEEETAEGQIEAVARNCVTQFVRDLLLLGFGARVEAEERQRVDVAQSRCRVGAIAEDVGQCARTNVYFCVQRRGPDFVVVKARLVDRDIERLAREAAAVLTRRTITLALEVIELTGQRQIAQTRFESAAQDQRFRRTVVRSVELVEEVAFIIVVVGAEFEQQRVFNDRAGDHTAGGVVGAAATGINWAVNRSAELAFELVGRVAGVDKHRAAGRVATEQDALRTAQDFDAFKVEKVEHDAAVEAEIDAIDEHADGRVNRGDRRVDAEAADREVRGAAAGADLVERNVGRLIAQALNVADLECFERVCVERGDCQRHVLHVFGVLRLGAGNDDVAEIGERASLFTGLRFGVVIIIRVLRICRHGGDGDRRKQQSAENTGGTLRCVAKFHEFLPDF